jgi:hypothetical protein
VSHRTYDVGDEVVLEATFKDPKTKALVEPTTVKCTVIDGKNQSSTYTAANSKGTYSVAVDANHKGTWRYRFVATGGFKAAAESWFEVRPQMVLSP